MCDLNRKCLYAENLAVGRGDRDARGGTETNVGELVQPFLHSVDLPDVHPLRIEDKLCIIEDYEDILGG